MSNYYSLMIAMPDWVIVITFLVVALFHFLAPRIYGRLRNHRLFVVPLYYLIAAMVAHFAASRFLNEPTFDDLVPKASESVFFHLLTWVKIILFVIGLLYFVQDLQSLRANRELEDLDDDIPLDGEGESNRT